MRKSYLNIYNIKTGESNNKSGLLCWGINDSTCKWLKNVAPNNRFIINFLYVINHKKFCFNNILTDYFFVNNIGTLYSLLGFFIILW